MYYCSIRSKCYDDLSISDRGIRRWSSSATRTFYSISLVLTMQSVSALKKTPILVCHHISQTTALLSC